jgi:hypothetical protein
MNQAENSRRLRLILDVFGIPVQMAAVEISRAAGRSYSRAYVSRVIHEGDFGSTEFFMAAEKALPNLVARKTVNMFELPAASVERLKAMKSLSDADSAEKKVA